MTDAPAPLRIAIIGSGPSGFYAADHLLKQATARGLDIQIDLIERLPTPFGLVRGGVAPDHQKIKTVTKAFDRIATDPRLRFYGNVRVGVDLRYDELLSHYHQIVFAVGAQSDRKMEIPGENLPGSHAATEFVGWYNANPDYRGLSFDLSASAAAIIGNGNVAMDVARILAKTPEELAGTDIADYALTELAKSEVKDIYVIGRRGPAQASFTPPEIKELGELACADVLIPLDELTLDPESAADVEQADDKQVRENLAAMRTLAERPPEGKPRRLHILFLRSPVYLHGTDRVESIEVVRNQLVRTADGSLRPRHTDQHETIPVGLVFRSIGYKGVPLPGHPFDEERGVLPNSAGRLSADGVPLVGEYAVGWIKRGPSGVIGSNRPDAVETADAMLDDAARGVLLHPAYPTREDLEHVLHSRGVDVVSYADWQILDRLEIAAGAAIGRPRLKYSRVEDMMAALRAARAHSAEQPPSP